jgi:hypothetical protein
VRSVSSASVEVWSCAREQWQIGDVEWDAAGLST